jgi:cob(I)alamin adenosyltransferase
MLERGLVQIYTGDGKGKTTASFGLALRAAGQGNRVVIYQFLKPPTLLLGEQVSMAKFEPDIHVEAMKGHWNVFTSLKNPEDVKQAQSAISEALKEILVWAKNRTYDLIILDEIVFCISKGLAKLEDVKKIIDQRDSRVELILTGRGATQELIDLADLVSEMRLIKHPHDKGITARRGIEF